MKKDKSAPEAEGVKNKDDLFFSMESGNTFCPLCGKRIAKKYSFVSRLDDRFHINQECKKCHAFFATTGIFLEKTEKKK